MVGVGSRETICQISAITSYMRCTLDETSCSLSGIPLSWTVLFTFTTKRQDLLSHLVLYQQSKPIHFPTISPYTNSDPSHQWLVPPSKLTHPNHLLDSLRQHLEPVKMVYVYHVQGTNLSRMDPMIGVSLDVNLLI